MPSGLRLFVIVFWGLLAEDFGDLPGVFTALDWLAGAGVLPGVLVAAVVLILVVLLTSRLVAGCVFAVVTGFGAAFARGAFLAGTGFFGAGSFAFGADLAFLAGAAFFTGCFAAGFLTGALPEDAADFLGAFVADLAAGFAAALPGTGFFFTDFAPALAAGLAVGFFTAFGFAAFFFAIVVAISGSLLCVTNKSCQRSTMAGVLCRALVGTSPRFQKARTLSDSRWQCQTSLRKITFACNLKANGVAAGMTCIK